MFIAAWNGGIIVPPCTTYEKNINVAGTTNNLYKKNLLLFIHCEYKVTRAEFDFTPKR